MDEIHHPGQTVDLHLEHLIHWKAYTVNMSYLEPILVHPTRRHNFAGKLHNVQCIYIFLQHLRLYPYRPAEVKFVHPVSPGGSVKSVASCVNFSIFTNFLCFFLLKLLKLGEIGGVKFLT